MSTGGGARTPRPGTERGAGSALLGQHVEVLTHGREARQGGPLHTAAPGFSASRPARRSLDPRPRSPAGRLAASGRGTRIQRFSASTSKS